MDGLTCDGCGEGLLLEADVRYVVEIQVYAAYDPLEITREDLARDQRSEMERLIERMREMDPQELQDGVHRKFRFDLCPRCQKAYLRGPLRFAASPGAGGEAPGAAGGA